MRRTSSFTAPAAIAALAIGSITLFLVDAEWLRVVSATVVVIGIAIGVFAIATPASLDDDPPPETEGEQ